MSVNTILLSSANDEKVDGENLESALNQANALINSSGTFSGKVISDWCSGAGFWAGGPATLAAAAIYSPDGIADVPSLPHQYTYNLID